MRDKNWKTDTTYEQRKNDWQPHDDIVNVLCRFQNFIKATQEEDYGGVDLWWENEPFDIKTTNGTPRSCPYKEEHNVFHWLLEHQDLDRFHNTNRIIIIIHNQKYDPVTVACQINECFNKGKVFKNIDYRLVGRDGQEKHPLYGQHQKMKFGLLIEVVN